MLDVQIFLFSKSLLEGTERPRNSGMGLPSLRHFSPLDAKSLDFCRARSREQPQEENRLMMATRLDE